MIKGRLRTEKSNYFFLFFSVFTLIFFIMSIIIFQILNLGVFDSVDQNLKKANANLDTYVDRTMRKTQYIADNGIIVLERIPFEETESNNKLVNVNLLLYDSTFEQFNTIDAQLEFRRLPLNTKKLGYIYSGEFETDFGTVERYRALTVKVHNASYPSVKYATFIVGTDQLEKSYKRTLDIVLRVLIVFWLLSSFTSIFLTNWTRKPILDAYEKQKEFVENASHELRTPLAVLQNRLETLFRRPNTTIIDNSENISSSLEEVRNMTILTKNLLNIARRDEGIVPNIKAIKPDFFDDIFDNFNLIAEMSEKELTVHNFVTSEIYSDPDLLRQLLVILFDNAVKYTDDNGQIDLTVKSKDKKLLINIVDNGIGISDEDKKKIFERFYRVDKSRTRQKGGFGLGLSLAQQIIKSLNGSIEVSDNLPKGTIFTVKL